MKLTKVATTKISCKPTGRGPQSSRGASIVEYTVLSSGLILVALIALVSFSDQAKSAFCLVASRMGGNSFAQGCALKSIQSDVENPAENSPPSECIADCPHVLECPEPVNCNMADPSGPGCSFTFESGSCMVDCSNCPKDDIDEDPTIPSPIDCSTENKSVCANDGDRYCLKYPFYDSERKVWLCLDDCSVCN